MFESKVVKSVSSTSSPSEIEDHLRDLRVSILDKHRVYLVECNNDEGNNGSSPILYVPEDTLNANAELVLTDSAEDVKELEQEAGKFCESLYLVMIAVTLQFINFLLVVTVGVLMGTSENFTSLVGNFISIEVLVQVPEGILLMQVSTKSIISTSQDYISAYSVVTQYLYRAFYIAYMFH